MLLLVALAATLLIKSHILSAKSLTDEQTKSIWTFLGVAFGAVVTLIGALLTEQHNRRTEALTRQAADREQAAREQEQRLADETEHRLKIDTMTKVLELITVEGGAGYAPRARVAGAIATLMQLEGGVIGMRILNELWVENAIDSDTACWLIDRILEDGDAPDDEVIQAANLLAVNAHRLIYHSDDPNLQVSFWPDSIGDSWPVNLPDDAKSGIFIAVIRMLLGRDINTWQRWGEIFPIDLLIDAIVDTDPSIARYSSIVLRTLNDTGALKKLDYQLDQHMDEIQEKASLVNTNPWIDNLLKQLRQWAAGEPYTVPAVPTSSSSTHAPSA